MRDPAAFEDRYRAEGDVWRFATSEPELARYDATVAALPKARYRSAYEPGCSVGVLTERLAHRCHRVLAVDLAPTAVELARERCIELGNVEVRVGSLLDAPEPGHDLVVLSEVGYYLEPDDLAAAVDRLVAALPPGGDLVGCHWLGRSPDHRLHGDTVHDLVDRHPDLVHGTHLVHGAADGRAGHRIDTWVRS